MDDVKFSEVQRSLAEDGIDHPPSEIHGLVCGWVCAGTKWGHGDRLAAMEEWLGAGIGEATRGLLDRLFIDTASGLRDEEFGFRLLLPGDDVPLNDRAAAVSAWCGGFLAGFGMTGRYRDGELSSDLHEVFEDLARISSLSEEVPDDEDNETDLVEIGEYVRMSALLVFTECAHQAVH